MNIQEIRKRYRAKCLEIAKKLVDKSSSYITFIVPYKYIKINNLDKNIIQCNYHTVLLSGRLVMDILHRDYLIDIEDYINELIKLNGNNIELDKNNSYIYDKLGYKKIPTIDELRSI